MCSSPDIDDPPPPPPPPQMAKAPDSGATRKKKTGTTSGGMGQSTSPVLLTGPGGVANSSLSLGTNTLLGGGTTK